jgi:uncharacterized integral membrane protein
MKVKLTLLVILLAPVLTFVYQNSGPVTLRFLKWTVSVPHALLLFALLLSGIFLGALLVIMRRAHNKKKKAKGADAPPASSSPPPGNPGGRAAGQEDAVAEGETRQPDNTGGGTTV